MRRAAYSLSRPSFGVVRVQCEKESQPEGNTFEEHNARFPLRFSCERASEREGRVQELLLELFGRCFSWAARCGHHHSLTSERVELCVSGLCWQWLVVLARQRARSGAGSKPRPVRRPHKQAKRQAERSSLGSGCMKQTHGY